jgi:hypothetical protein
MIITIGALFLMDQNSYIGFDRTWPVILLVAGLFSYLGRAASIEGHVQPYVAAYPQQGYGQPGYAQPGYAPAQASAQAGPTASTPNDRLNNDRSSNDPTNDDRSNNDPQVNS